MGWGWAQLNIALRSGKYLETWLHDVELAFKNLSVGPGKKWCWSKMESPWKHARRGTRWKPMLVEVDITQRTFSEDGRGFRRDTVSVEDGITIKPHSVWKQEENDVDWGWDHLENTLRGWAWIQVKYGVDRGWEHYKNTISLVPGWKRCWSRRGSPWKHPQRMSVVLGKIQCRLRRGTL